MGNVYIKTVDGGEDTTPSGTDAIELDDGSTSKYALLSNLHLALTAASATVASVVELATAAETTTGTDATRAVTPDGLAGSNVGKVAFGGLVQAGTITTGDGKAYFGPMPAKVNGMNLISVVVSVITKSTSGTPTVQVVRGRQANATSAHTFVDMLTTLATIDANEYSSCLASRTLHRRRTGEVEGGHGGCYPDHDE